MKKVKLLFLIMAFVMISINSRTYAKGANFSDVKTTAWYYKDLEMLSSRNIINGYTDGTFKPSNTLTREEFIKMVVTTIAPIKYEKGNSSWSMPYLKAAKEYGFLLYDIDDKEMLKKPIVREEVACIISNVLNEGFENYEGYKNEIKDYEDINEAYKNDVLKIYSKGIIVGYPDGKFEPKKSLTRAEATAILSRVIYSSMRLKDADKAVSYKLTSEDISRLKAYPKNQELTGYKAEINYNTIEELEKEQGVDFETIATYYVENLAFGFDYRYLYAKNNNATKLANNIIFQRTCYRVDNFGAHSNLGRNDYIKTMFKKVVDNNLIADAVFYPLEGGTYISENNTIRVRGMVVQKYLYSGSENYNTFHEYKYDVEIEIVLDPELKLGVSRYYKLKAETPKFYTLDDIKNLYNKDLAKIAKDFIEQVEYKMDYEIDSNVLLDNYSKYFPNYEDLKTKRLGKFIVNNTKYDLYDYIYYKHAIAQKNKIKQASVVTNIGEVITEDNVTLYVPMTVKYVYTNNTDQSISLNKEYIDNIQVRFEYNMFDKNFFMTGYKKVKN